jgi:outer membrane protein
MNSRLLTAAALVLSSAFALRAQTAPAPRQSPPAAPPNAPAATAQAAPVRLRLADAEQLALRNNPRIAVGRLLALAQNQVTREARSSEYPTVTGNLTAVDSHPGSRITAGALNNPVVYQRAAGGITLSQLITDFGRTHNLVGSAELRAKAEASAADATAADVILAVDEAYYRALGAQSVLNVANETVKARQTTVDQISALTSAKLRSTLDLSFANVALAQAKLLLLDATVQSQDALAALNALLGEQSAPHYVLADEGTAAAPPPDDPEALVGVAFEHRPDLQSATEQAEAAKKFSAAEHDLNRPTLSALGTAGGSPIRSDQITSSWYGAAGVNLSIPIFNGFLFSARAQEADLRARAAQQQVKELQDTIARDVRTTALQAQSNFQRIVVAQQLLDQASSALDLAQTRYNLGLSSIVELSQAQLAQTQAQIDLAEARYAYAGSLASIRFQTGQ